MAMAAGEPQSGNLLDKLPVSPLPEEIVDVLAEGPAARIERIVSTGQMTPKGKWYDQHWAEFVVLLRGGARLQIETEDAERLLGPGDWLLLPARCRHRVTWTTEDEPTVWLAVHASLAING